MPAPKGNQFWLARAKSGRGKIFSSPDVLWTAACEYFQWAEDNPLTEYRVAQFQGVPVEMSIPKMRAMTLAGLYLFLDIDERTWRNYRSNEVYEDFFQVITQVEDVIYSQKFAGAAADLLNANIISRELGLKDASSTEHSGPGGGAIELGPSDLSNAVLDAKIKAFSINII